LSDAQVYRLIHYTPERLSLKTLSALCDIFECTPNDLVVPYVEGSQQPLTAVAGELKQRRPVPAAKPPLSALPDTFTPVKADLGPTKKRP
jgi:hypothetical protein